MRSFHNLPWTNLPSALIVSDASFPNSWKSLIFKNLLILRYPLLCLRNIKWHCIGKIFGVLWYTTSKCIFRPIDISHWYQSLISRDRHWYQSFIDLITYKIAVVLSIHAWHFIRDHHLIYIDRNHISYLSLHIKVFGCSFFWRNLNIFFYYYIFRLGISEGKKKKNFHDCSVSFFSSSGTHQSHHLDECQAIGITSFLFVPSRSS